MKSLFLGVVIFGLAGVAVAGETQKTYGGTCSVYTETSQDILYKVVIPFRFPEVAKVAIAQNGKAQAAVFGAGQVTIDKSVVILGADRQMVTVPLKIDLKLSVSADKKAKILHADVSMYDIFNKTQVANTVDAHSAIADDINGESVYLQSGFGTSNPHDVPADQITGSFVYCGFEEVIVGK